MMKPPRIAVIGSGIVGTAIARELSKYDAEIFILEKEPEISLGATRASSSIVHPGFRYWKPGTLRARAVREGLDEIKRLSTILEFPFKEVGELIVARNEDEYPKLNKYMEQGKTNGLENLRMITAEELRDLEPNICDDAIGAMFAPSAAVAGSFDCAIAFAESAQINGASIHTDEEVLSIRKDKDKFIIETELTTYSVDIVINAAGGHVEKLAKMLGEELPIILQRGQEYVFDKSVGDLVNHMVFPASGAFVIPTVHGNLMVGTCKTNVNDTRDTPITQAVWDKVFKGAQALIPALSRSSVIRGFAGVRPNPADGDIQIVDTVKGAVSAVTGSPGIQTSVIVAKWVVEKLTAQGFEFTKKDDFIPERENIKAFSSMTEVEREKAVAEDPMYSHLICRCEHVSEAEIVEAIRRGARTMDGVKYRTRAGMGRCQGGFCGPRVAQIISRETGIPVEKILKNSSMSMYVKTKTKEILLESQRS